MYTNVHQYVQFTPIYINVHQCTSMYIDVYQCKPMTKYMPAMLVYVTKESNKNIPLMYINMTASHVIENHLYTNIIFLSSKNL